MAWSPLDTLNLLRGRPSTLADLGNTYSPTDALLNSYQNNPPVYGSNIPQGMVIPPDPMTTDEQPPSQVPSDPGIGPAPTPQAAPDVLKADPSYNNPWVARVLGGMVDWAKTPGTLAYAKNPYPEGSELWHAFEDDRQNLGMDWARNTALGMMGGSPAFSVKAAPGEAVLTAGAARRVAAPDEIAAARSAIEDKYGAIGSHPDENALNVNSILHPDTPAAAPRSQTVEEIAARLHERGQEALKNLGVDEGKIEYQTATPHQEELVSRAMAAEVKGAIDRGGKTATDWYTKSVDEAMQHAEAIHPELKDDPHQQMAFRAALAITSQGENVPSNVRLAEIAYNYFKKNGRFPTNISADAGKQMNGNFQKLNDLVDNLGPEGTRDFLNKQFTVKELSDLGHKVGGENMGTKVYGSSIFGPKIGQGFYQNLNGNYDPVTMDLWFMRAMGRLTGSLVGKADISPQIERLTNAMKEKGMAIPEDQGQLANIAEDVMRQHERDFRTDRAAYDTGEKKKSELTFAADRYLQNLRGINEQPTGGGHREWMRDRVNRAREILKDQGHDLTNADLQAIWWYPEKDLYAKLGGIPSEAINTDYATVYRDLRSQR